MRGKSGEIYDFEEFRLNVPEHLLLRQNEPVALPDKAFEILHLLVRNAGSLVEKEKILHKVWADSFVEENNLDKNISILRRTLGEKKGEKKFIQTVRGHGYRFVAPVEKSELCDTAGSFFPVEIQITKNKLDNPQTGLRNSPSIRREVQRTGNVLALSDWRGKPDKSNAESEILENSAAVAIRVEEKNSAAPKQKTFISYMPRAAVFVLTVAIVGFFAIYFFTPSGTKKTNAPPFENFKIKRYFDNGSFNPAVISSDGKFIAFTDKKFAVWLKNTATDSNIKILSEIETGERFVIGISPDDGYIYFRYVPPDKRSEIYKLAVFSGASPQKIGEGSWSQPVLSPDGKQISFTRFDTETGKYFLVAVATDGAGERTIAVSRENERFDSWNQNTAWSPDSSQVACLESSETGENKKLFIQIFQTGSAGAEEISRIKLDPAIRLLEAVAWLPDGDSFLVIGEDEASIGQIYLYRRANGSWRRVTNDLTDYRNLSVTADGKKVLATSFQNQSNLWVLPGSDVASAKQISFGFNTIDDSTGVSWTADGKIIYASNAGGRWEIWTINSDGTNQKQLTQNCAGNDACVMPFVSPDNRYIVFQASRGGEHNIWRMDLDGGNPVQLTFDGGILPFITADSRTVIYVKKKISTSTLWQVPLEGGEASRMSKIAPIFLGSLSPDGNRLAFVSYDKSSQIAFPTCIASVEAVKPEKCFGKSRAFPHWTADGKAFYYLAHDYSAIWKQPQEGERELFLQFPGERINNFAFAPDGKQILVARSKPTQDIVALVDEQK